MTRVPDRPTDEIGLPAPVDLVGTLGECENANPDTSSPVAPFNDR